MLLKMSDTDLQLLARYARHHAEDAFAEIVRRHLGLVYSAARRQVRSPQLAEEVAQSAFTDLARNSRRLAPDTVLTAWLYQVTRRTAIDVVRREARRQLREQIATEMNALNAESGTGREPAWSEIEPLLDEAMDALDDTDRAAVLLRYFENKSLREVGQQLGVSDDAAQKRVSRAVERLREFFAKRGVTVGAGGLAAVISANAVHAAPAGLAVTISTAAALAGTSLATTTTITATKAIAMTALHKTLITAFVAVLTGAGIYEARQASQLRSQVLTLQQQQAPLISQSQELSQALLDATNRLASFVSRTDEDMANNRELLRLRGEVTRLKAAAVQRENDPIEATAAAWVSKLHEIKGWLQRTPGEAIPELALLSETELLKDVADMPPASKVAWASSVLRTHAKKYFAPFLGAALSDYLLGNNGQLPNDLTELKPYFRFPVDDAMLQRYELLHTGNVSDLSPAEPLVAEKTPIQNGQYDAVFKVGAFGFSYQAVDPLGGSGSGPFYAPVGVKGLFKNP